MIFYLFKGAQGGELQDRLCPISLYWPAAGPENASLSDWIDACQCCPPTAEPMNTF